MGVDNVGGSGISKAAADCHRLVEGVNVEVPQRSSQIRLPWGVSPYLGEHRMGGVQLFASFGGSLHEGPQAGIDVLAIGNERSCVDDQWSTP